MLPATIHDVPQPTVDKSRSAVRFGSPYVPRPEVARDYLTRLSAASEDASDSYLSHNRLTAHTALCLMHLTGMRPIDVEGTDRRQMLFSPDEAEAQIVFESKAARGYKAAAKSLHDFLRDEAGVSVADVNWGSRELYFYEGYRERALITESEFALGAAGAAGEDSSQGLRVALVLMRRAGLRCAEVAGLEARDFRGFDELRLSIRTSKTSAGRRTLPLFLLLDAAELDEVRRFVRARADGARPRQRMLLTSEGAPSEAARLSDTVESLLRRAGVRNQIAHGLRHAFASSLLVAWWLRYTEGFISPPVDAATEQAKPRQPYGL